MINIHKNIKYRILISVLAVLLSNIVYSQSKSFENILEMSDVSSGVLLEGENIRGYYYFYQVDNAKRGKYVYWLTILDQNLNIVKTSQIEEENNVRVVEAKYNGKNILFKLLEGAKIVLMRYDLNGELIKKYEKGWMSRLGMAVSGTEFLKSNTLIDIKNVGFVNIDMTDKGFKLDMIPTDESIVNEWTYDSETKKGLELGRSLIATDKVVYTSVIMKKSLLSGNLELYLQGNDVKTGKEIFKTSLADKYQHQPLTFYHDKNSGLVNFIGIFYDPGEKIMKDNGMGLFRFSVDDKGTISNQKYLTWTDDFSKHVQVSKKGQIGEGKSYVYFHDIIQRPDGSILAIGEQYESGSIVAEITVKDLVLCHFSPDFTINSIEFIDKAVSECSIPGGISVYNVHLLAHIVKAYGGFDYMFSQNIEKDNAITIGYVDFVKPEKEKKKWIFGAITIKDGQLTSDKMDLGNVKSEDKIIIHQAKPGYILVEEYNEKEKRVDIHLERINY